MASPRSKAAGIVVASASLLAFTTNYEGNKTVVYKDIAGVPTVCVGHTGPEVKFGDVWTKEQCDKILILDVAKHGEGLLKCVTVPLNQNQYEALADWAFNVGVGNACGSTLVKLLNQGKYEAACDQLLLWNRAGGKEVAGLTKRRKGERELCLKPIQTTVPVATKVGLFHNLGFKDYNQSVMTHFVS